MIVEKFTWLVFEKNLLIIKFGNLPLLQYLLGVSWTQTHILTWYEGRKIHVGQPQMSNPRNFILQMFNPWYYKAWGPF